MDLSPRRLPRRLLTSRSILWNDLTKVACTSHHTYVLASFNMNAVNGQISDAKTFAGLPIPSRRMDDFSLLIGTS